MAKGSAPPGAFRMRYDGGMRTRHVAAVMSLAAALALIVAGTIRAQAPIRARVHASGLSSPVAFVQDPTDRQVQFAVEQAGRIRAVRDGTVLPASFLDVTSSVLSGGERGLLGLAFAPDYASSGRFYVNFTNAQGHTVIARFRRSADPVVADAGSRFDLRWVPGSSRSSNSPSRTTMADISHSARTATFTSGLEMAVPATIPATMPRPAAPCSARCCGLTSTSRTRTRPATRFPRTTRLPPARRARGPRYGASAFATRGGTSFDLARGTGALVIADVGQNAWEEIDYEPRARGGRNYGWRNREGAHDNITSRPPAFLPLVDPIHEYDRATGASITGGFVYRGATLGAAFRGRYFFADFATSRVWSIALNVNPQTGEATASGRTEHTAELGGATALAGVSSFGIDADQELYIVSHSRGIILRVLGNTSPPAAPTGLRIIR